MELTLQQGMTRRIQAQSMQLGSNAAAFGVGGSGGVAFAEVSDFILAGAAAPDFRTPARC